jgi:AmmeMemoRadiSam system protein B/AmmeMemoRadiSam system protein A
MPVRSVHTTHPSDIRQPVVAGMFYPDNPDRLIRMVDGFLNAVQPVDAGFVYSGPVAAYSYRQVQGISYDAIVIIGNNHRDPAFGGISVWARGAWETPLGRVPVDEDLAAALLGADSRISDVRSPHLNEHSIEVQLPFLQRVCPDNAIVPVMIGNPSPENISILSQALAQTLVDKKTLIIASSDLSHYPNYDDAIRVDGATLHAIETLDPDMLLNTLAQSMKQHVPNLATCACGTGPLLVAMNTARSLGAEDVKILHYANSGDIENGDQNRVVGYGAVMFWRQESLSLTTEDQQILLTLARDTITAALNNDELPPAPTGSPMFEQKVGVFVTLRWDGQLRGCMGDRSGRHPLGKTIQHVALMAALEDPRFMPVQAKELDRITIEISVLSPVRRILDPERIEIGVHGLVIRSGNRAGLLLPQVPISQGWDRHQFLEGLCRKAGLPKDAWRQGALLYTFTSEVFGDPEQ